MCRALRRQRLQHAQLRQLEARLLQPRALVLQRCLVRLQARAEPLAPSALGPRLSRCWLRLLLLLRSGRSRVLRGAPASL